MYRLDKMFLVATLASASCANALAQSTAPAAVNVDQWSDQVETAMPLLLCRAESPWHLCYPATGTEQCEEDVASATRICLKKLGSYIAEQTQNIQTTSLENRFSTCISGAFELLYQTRAPNTTDCKAANNYLRNAFSRIVTKNVQNLPTTQPRSIETCNQAPGNTKDVGYPEALINTGEHGKVLLRIQIGEAGGVKHIELVESSGYPRLDEWTLAKAQQWSFDAAACGGLSLLTPIEFVLPRPNAKNVVANTSAAYKPDKYLKLVDWDERKQYWSISSEPKLPGVLRRLGSGFCSAIGFSIKENGVPSNVLTIQMAVDNLSKGMEDKVRNAAENYVRSLRFTPAPGNSMRVPVFTYTVIGKYWWRWGDGSSGEKRVASDTAAPCEQAAKAVMEDLRSSSR